MTKAIIEIINGAGLVLGGIMIGLILVLAVSDTAVIHETDEGMFTGYEGHVYRLELVE